MPSQTSSFFKAKTQDFASDDAAARSTSKGSGALLNNRTLNRKSGNAYDAIRAFQLINCYELLVREDGRDGSNISSLSQRLIRFLGSFSIDTAHICMKFLPLTKIKLWKPAASK